MTDDEAAGQELAHQAEDLAFSILCEFTGPNVRPDTGIREIGRALDADGPGALPVLMSLAGTAGALIGLLAKERGVSTSDILREIEDATTLARLDVDVDPGEERPPLTD